MKIIKSTAPIGGVFQIELKWFNLKTVLGGRSAIPQAANGRPYSAPSIHILTPNSTPNSTLNSPLLTKKPPNGKPLGGSLCTVGF